MCPPLNALLPTRDVGFGSNVGQIGPQMGQIWDFFTLLSQNIKNVI